MDIYLTDLETGDRLRLPMLPEEIKVQTGMIFQSYTVLSIGEIKLPAGEELTGFSWEGILPGEPRKNEPYVVEWRDPNEIQSIWSVYRAQKKKLRLLVTETPINHDVNIANYNMTYRGGHGDAYYDIVFSQAKDLIVNEVSKITIEPYASLSAARPSPPTPKTYTVVKGDSLWKIAQKLLGSGAKYTLIFEANKSVIGSNPNLIYPGQILTIPS